MQARTRSMRRSVLIVLAVSIGMIALMLLAVFLIGKLGNGGNEIETQDYEFYPPYEGDIMENPAYLELDRQVYYCEDPNGYGATVSITDENRADFDPSVLFLYEYIQTIINGDAAAYNKLFSDHYYLNGKPQDAFSQQMLHNIKIRLRSESKEGEERIVTYRVEYEIHRNDGSFRRDVGSDASRPQDITLRIDRNGSIAIEQIVTWYSK